MLPSAKGSRLMALATARSAESREEASISYETNKAAASAAPSRDSYMRTWSEFHLAWFGNEFVFPLTVEKIAAVAGMFEAGRYRSYPNYMDRVKEKHVVLGFAWTEQLALEARKSKLSVLRGIGPARQSEPFDLIRVCRAEASVVDVLGAPASPRQAFTVACFWLLREIELAHLLHSSVTVNREQASVTLRLSVSKTDPQALGCSRSWGCVCDGKPDVLCGYHAVVFAVECNLAYFTAKGMDVPPDWPLFPSVGDGIMSKEGVITSLERFAVGAGLDIVGQGGRRRFGGHSFRVTGARRLAAMGIEVMVIMCLARWESHVVMRYVQEAPLATLTDRYRLLQGGRTYEDKLGELREELHTISENVAMRGKQLDELREDATRLAALPRDEVRVTELLFVVNCSSSVVHRVLHGDATSSSLTWATRCGWRFGASEHLRCGDLRARAGERCCKTCWIDMANA